MSLRLRLLNQLLGLVAPPIQSRTTDPFAARVNFDRIARLFRRPPNVLHLVDAGPVPLHWVSARRRRIDWVILYLNGGAYLTGSPLTHFALVARIARMTGLQAVMPGYRLAPEHPAPAAFDDAVAAHARLLAKGFAPERIILAGDSAGGGLALALLADLCARNLTPAGLFAFSPWTDLALTGESLVSHADFDWIVPTGQIREAVDLVLAGGDPRDPRVSPLYAAFHRPPPVFFQVGSREMLRDDSRRMAEVLRQAGGQVIVEEWPECPHVWQMLDGYLPEAREALLHTADFVARLVSSSSPPPAGS
ncbi:MAG: alpha/beta hydrolase fold domain-containing protein [bacterium]